MEGSSNVQGAGGTQGPSLSQLSAKKIFLQAFAKELNASLKEKYFLSYDPVSFDLKSLSLTIRLPAKNKEVSQNIRNFIEEKVKSNPKIANYMLIAIDEGNGLYGLTIELKAKRK